MPTPYQVHLIMSHNNPSSQDPFYKAVHRLRDGNKMLLQQCNLFDKPCLNSLTEEIHGHEVVTYWFDDGTPLGQCIRLVDIPGTLSGDTLRLRANPPPNQGGHLEIAGDVVRAIENPPSHPHYPDGSEDISPALALLPVVEEVDRSKHFVKKGKYQSEIHNLIKCQGGSCPGTPISLHIVRLLGKSRDGELVFEKLLSAPYIILSSRFCSIAIYKRWILQMIAALKYLHSLGIIHRDMHIGNLLFSADGERLVVADLECHWGQRTAPEITWEDRLDSNWTEKSDIYDIGVCIKCIIYANNPRTGQILVDWPVPPPFEDVVKACMQPNPLDRPSLEELSLLVDAIET